MEVIIREYEYENDYDYENDYKNRKLLNESYIDGLTLFVWDGCHKIYLVENMNDIKSVKETWGKDTTFYCIDELPEVWYSSCSLRFIQNWSLTKNYVRQFNGAGFEFID